MLSHLSHGSHNASKKEDSVCCYRCEWLMHFATKSHPIWWTSSIGNRSLWKRHKKRENRIFINNSVKERDISSFAVVFLVDCERGEQKWSQNYKFELIIRLRNKWRYPNKSYLDISSFIPCLAITTENKWIFALNGERNGKIKDVKNTILQIKQCKTANVCRKKINYI